MKMAFSTGSTAGEDHAPSSRHFAGTNDEKFRAAWIAPVAALSRTTLPNTGGQPWNEATPT